jgi:anti-sigma regulatory factor (Ser/Thr protein kinase)
VVLRVDGSADFLESDPSVPLGVLPYGRYRVYEGALEPGEEVLLYTDGLVESRGAPLTLGLEQLRGSVVGSRFDPEDLCEHVLSVMLPSGPPLDDVALLALRSVPVSGPRLHLAPSADPDELSTVRHTLERWLEAGNVDSRAAHRIVLATNEACMNAIEHSRGGGSFVVDATLGEDSVDVTVRDDGRWREARGRSAAGGGAGGGLGLDMMRSLVDVVEVMPAEEGTTVWLRRSLS